MVSAVKDHLNDFGVSVDSHCVVRTSDGASVMCKFLRLMPTVGVMCYSHGIHLAVGDVMYKNTPKDLITRTTTEMMTPNGQMLIIQNLIRILRRSRKVRILL